MYQLIILKKGLALLLAVGTGGTWQLGSSEVGKFGSHGNVVFEVFSTASRKGYVAIDDVKMDTYEACPLHGKFMLL